MIVPVNESRAGAESPRGAPTPPPPLPAWGGVLAVVDDPALVQAPSASARQTARIRKARVIPPYYSTR